jgi:hypothetical protein
MFSGESNKSHSYMEIANHCNTKMNYTAFQVENQESGERSGCSLIAVSLYRLL